MDVWVFNKDDFEQQDRAGPVPEEISKEVSETIYNTPGLEDLINHFNAEARLPLFQHRAGVGVTIDDDRAEGFITAVNQNCVSLYACKPC